MVILSEQQNFHQLTDHN